eukprot:COSAG02_NODE_4237_length_5599_cov_6.352000_5_plen_91_part_00
MIKLNGGTLPEKKKPKSEKEAGSDKPPPPPPPPPPPEATISELSDQSVLDGCLEIEVIPVRTANLRSHSLKDISPPNTVYCRIRRDTLVP